jgi:hypothetical protein
MFRGKSPGREVADVIGVSRGHASRDRGLRLEDHLEVVPRESGPSGSPGLAETVSADSVSRPQGSSEIVAYGPGFSVRAKYWLIESGMNVRDALSYVSQVIDPRKPRPTPRFITDGEVKRTDYLARARIASEDGRFVAMEKLYALAIVRFARQGQLAKAYDAAYEARNYSLGRRIARDVGKFMIAAEFSLKLDDSRGALQDYAYAGRADLSASVGMRLHQ